MLDGPGQPAGARPARERLREAAGRGRRRDGELHLIVPRRPYATVDPPLLRDDLEQPRVVVDRLGAAEEEVPALREREVHQRKYPPLRLRFEVDEEVPTADEVEPGERRIGDQVLRRERHRLPQLPDDTIGVRFRYEEALQALGR